LSDNRATETIGDEHPATQPQRNGRKSGSERAGSGHGTPAKSRNSTSFTSESAREAARASVRVRREKKAAREQRAQDNALTFRQRLGVALSKLEQDDLDQVVAKLVNAGNANALARLADQAFGRPSEQDSEAGHQRSGLSRMSRDQLASTLAELDALTVTREHPSPNRLTAIEG
jgi:hypothetical protein